MRQKIRLAHGEHVGDVALIARAHLDAERVGEHEAGNPRAGFDGDLGRDPGAERDADERHVLEPQLVHQVEIEIGEVVDRGEVLRLLGAAEARMGRRDDSRLGGKQVEHRGVGRDADAGMEEEDRGTLAALDPFEPYARDRSQLLGQARPPVSLRSMPRISACHPRRTRP